MVVVVVVMVVMVVGTPKKNRRDRHPRKKKEGRVYTSGYTGAWRGSLSIARDLAAKLTPI